MINNKLVKLEERLEDLKFEKGTCEIKLESLGKDDLCESSEKEKVEAEKKLRIIDNLIKVLEKQTESCRGENAGTTQSN